MRIFDDLSKITKDDNTILTLGTFDGIHLGHRKILEKVKKKATVSHSRSLLITFDPHPRKIITPDYHIKLLTNQSEKTKLLEATGIDILLVINFTKEFSQLTSEEFIKEYLLKHIGIKEIIVGHDHHFGKGRSGDANTLRKLGVENNFEVTMVDAYKINGETVNSTAIRKALIEGDIKKANTFLGRRYSFDGTVIQGDQRGRTLGFPTANILAENHDKLLPALGIYAVNFFIEGETVKGLMSVGKRPTFYNSGETVTEVYLYDFDRDIYGKKVSVEIVDWIRGEEKFNSAEELIAQMQKDKIKGLEIFKKAS